VREFALKLDASPTEVLRRCAAHGVNPGYHLGEAYPELGDGLLVAITERHSRAQIDTLVETLRQAVSTEVTRAPEAVKA
jgi:glycine dehydrogenase subunit 1